MLIARNCRVVSPPSTIKEIASKSSVSSTSAAVEATSSLSKIQQAKNHAITQAQQDGATGNFKAFDAPFGNFLIPVIPTREDLMAETNDKTS
ncbi:hypothetical protein Ancab_028545 [Ancistrocladus abbreviatus]